MEYPINSHAPRVLPGLTVNQISAQRPVDQRAHLARGTAYSILVQPYFSRHGGKRGWPARETTYPSGSSEKNGTLIIPTASGFTMVSDRFT